MPYADYSRAQEAYSELGVDTEAVLRQLGEIPVSIHCWQGDDVGGFENPGGELTGGIQATGNHPGKARTPAELRADLDQALALIPGRHRLNLHAIYADTGGRKIERDELTAEHFQSWIDWCAQRRLGMDFNPTFFSHPLADNGQTLTHPDARIREFWVRHGIACRRIGAEAGKQLGAPCITNVWIPDGSKDLPVDRSTPRARLEEALDAIFEEPLEHNLDAVESKLFGIGSESYVAGSHEFYLGYAATRRKILCLDAGHFHPTESVADKISAVLRFVPGVLLHVSRGVRWDSDHVVIMDDPTKAIAEEVVRGGFLDRVYFGLDFFDASINRVAAWVIGTRAACKCLLLALLEPRAKLLELEQSGDFAGRLALLEECRSLPWGAVWEEHCRRHEMPGGFAWMDIVRAYENKVLETRRA